MREMMKTIMFMCAVGSIILLLINSVICLCDTDYIGSVISAMIGFGLAISWYYAIARKEKE